MDVLDDLSIINRALGRIGGGTIFALDEDHGLANQVVPVHEDLVEAALGLWHWNWARRTKKLERLADAPETGWAYAYAFPASAVSQPLRLMTDPRSPSNPLREFQTEGREVHADAGALWGAFVMRVVPDLWSAPFRLAYTDWLAARLCIPVTHDASLAAQLEQLAVGAPSENLRGGLMGRAIAMDAAGANGTAPLAATDALTSARFDGGAWFGGDTGW